MQDKQYNTIGLVQKKYEKVFILILTIKKVRSIIEPEM